MISMSLNAQLRDMFMHACTLLLMGPSLQALLAYRLTMRKCFSESANLMFLAMQVEVQPLLSPASK